MRWTIAWLLIVLPALALADYSGNMAVNPGFEEDFVNLNGEGDVLSFKGDWYYGQTDGVPDYWALPKAGWEWCTERPHGGSHCLRLADKAIASRDFSVAATQIGGGSWGGAQTDVPKCQRPEQFPRTVRLSASCRAGGMLRLTCAGVKKELGIGAVAGDLMAWQKLELTITAAEQPAGSHNSLKVELIGPGDFDDVTLQEELDGSPNLLPNAGFEDLKDGFPTGWSQQKKYTWMGPTYYIWTDWYHFHQPNRGEVAADTLITSSGGKSLRFDVLPGDEKMVEGPEIVLNQDAPRLVEIGAMVRADRIMLLDIRAADQDGVDLPCMRPRQPEVKATPGGTIVASALYGNGTFEWRYVRKVFAPRFGQPLKSIRPRLCARGFNGFTPDDGGTRHYCLQAGTVWWDDVRVVERESNADQLKARGVQIPAEKSGQLQPVPVRITSIDFGERLVGPNHVTLSWTGPQALTYRIRHKLPDREPTVFTDKLVDNTLPVDMSLFYETREPLADFHKPASLEISALIGGKVVGDTRISYYTWPVVADFDFEHHVLYPDENPVVCTVNLGVVKSLIDQAKTIELVLERVRDGAQIDKQVITDVAGALEAGAKGAWKDERLAKAYSVFVADHTNLIALALDVGKLKVWPQDEPTRDTCVHLRGLDAAGKLLFEAKSQPIGRVERFDRNRMELIKTVAVRKEDGAVLVNGQPVFLTGGTHQNARLSHGPAELDLYGFRGHRLTEGNLEKNFDTFWTQHHLWELQAKPVQGAGTSSVQEELTEDQFAALKKVVDAGRHLNIISYNTGGWEGYLADQGKWPAHYKSNDRIRQMTGRLIAISTSGAYNAWEFSRFFPWYDIDCAETEMWGPMDFNTIYLPNMNRRAPEGRRSTWLYLPQLYDNHPFARLRFETYENIIRGSCGYAMIQGIGDPSFNRAMCGELRYLEKPLYSLEKAPAVSFTPDVSHKVTRYQDKLYVLATNAGPIRIGAWAWHEDQKFSGRASHDGESRNAAWRNPNGWHLHGYRGDPCGGSAPTIQAGDVIVQHVWIDPKQPPECVVFGVRGDGMFAHNLVLGKFDFNQFAADASNVFLFTETEHSVWHHVGMYFDKEKEARARKIMGDEYANKVRAASDVQHKWVTDNIYKPEHFVSLGGLPKAGEWVQIEVPAEKVGLVGTLVDGFIFAAKNGHALWDHTALVRGGKEVAVFCEDSAGIDAPALAAVTVALPGVPDGTPVKVLFEDRALTVQGGKFTDSFVGEDAYGLEWGGVEGDNYAYMPGREQQDFRELVTILPSGYGYDYNAGKTAVHIYEIPLK
jgi:hypothetical protein